MRLTKAQKWILIVFGILDLLVVSGILGMIGVSYYELSQPLFTFTPTVFSSREVVATWTPTLSPTPRPTIAPFPTPTATLRATLRPTNTPVPPTPTPSPTPMVVRIMNPDFEITLPNRLAGWKWDAYVNYRPGDKEYSPENSYAEPLLMPADDPVRQIHGSTLKIETIRWLKFRAWVHQTISVTAGSQVVFTVRANVYSSLDRVKVQAGIEPNGVEYCYKAFWGPELVINQNDGVVVLQSPKATVGEAGSVTLCIFAEPTYAHVNNAAFFDLAEVSVIPPPPRTPTATPTAALLSPEP